MPDHSSILMHQPKSPNLIFVRAGDESLHSIWRDGARAGHYDLIVSYFGDNPHAYRSPEEHRTDYKGGKWDGIYAAFSADPSLLDRFRYIWLPDDDIAADCRTIVEMFQLMETCNLAVAQPALTPDSYFSHLLYLQCPSFRLRYVNAVEIMVPCLRSDALRMVLPLMKSLRFGFGLDYIWTRLFSDNQYKSAILDTISVRHTRPIGSALHTEMAKTGISAFHEEAELLARVGIGKPPPLCYAGIRGKDDAHLLKQAIIAFMMARDWKKSYGQMVQTHDWRQQLRRNLRRHMFSRVLLDQIALPQVNGV